MTTPNTAARTHGAAPALSRAALAGPELTTIPLILLCVSAFCRISVSHITLRRHMHRDRQPRVDRANAEHLLALAMVPHMSLAAQEDALVDAWQYASEQDIRDLIADGGLPQLSDETIVLISTTDSPPAGLFDGRDAILYDWCQFQLRYVTNGYIAETLASHGQRLAVDGSPRDAGMCPCCKHLSIDPGEDGICDICPVCGWENFGEGPNHMSLKNAQSNFARFGAISEAALQSVDRDGPRKYPRAEAGEHAAVADLVLPPSSVDPGS